MSTFYAGQEGSFLLWGLFTAIVGLVLLEYTSKRGDLEPRVMMIFTFALTFLLVMVNPLLKSPFNYIWSEVSYLDIKNMNQTYLSVPFIQNFIFQDSSTNTTYIKMGKELYAHLSANSVSLNEFIIEGKGLNPLLQNFWMQIHPPALFIGFAMSTVPFAFAVSALIKNEYRDWVKQALPWVLAGTMILGFAIMLGGYWAYGVLGWGGYWGWDPVENSSLVPWIIGVASVHTLLVQRKTQGKKGIGRFVKTNLILAVLTYVLVLYSTFLTRSGILGDASVHSFGEPGMLVYWLLIIFMLSFVLMGLGGLAFRWKYLEKHFTHEENILSRELALFTGSVALIASAIIILVGTSTPIFGTSVEISFYNELNLPIAIIIGLLNGFSLLLKWKQTGGKDLLKNSKITIAATLISTLLIVLIGGVYDIMLVILTIATAFSLFVNLEIAFKILRGRKTFLGAYISHIGIALFLLGVVATGGYTKDKQLDLVKGDKVNLFGYDLTFLGYKPIDNGKKYAFEIEIIEGGRSSIVSPVMYIAEFNNSLMREPDILNQLTKDLYISPIGFEEGNNTHASENHVSLTKGETKRFNGVNITFVEFNFPPKAMAAMQAGKDFYIGAVMEVEFNGTIIRVEPKMQNSGGVKEYVGVEIKEANIKIDMENLDAGGKVDLHVSNLKEAEQKSDSENKETLTIEASVKPFINLVWAGVLVMVFGFIISIVRRTRESIK
jgi:cytochrome c-type biogenesis protein CcmF